MAHEFGATAGQRKYRSRIKYFFLNDQLHKVLHVNRPLDLVQTWCYPERGIKMYSWTLVKKEHKKAWSTSQVAKLVGREAQTIRRMLVEGAIPHPKAMTYSLDGEFKDYMYAWSEEEIVRLHEYLLTIHVGRPRKDGRVTPASTTPTRAELRARLRGDVVYYVKNDKGEFVRVWKEPEW